MGKTRLTTHTRFVLLDANVVAGYYLPASLASTKAVPLIENIITAVRSKGAPEVLLYIPEVCIAEVFAVFAKYFFARWDKQVRKRLPRKLKKAEYEMIVGQFRSDFHSGKLLNPVALSPYHILATHLISSVDANYQYYRNRQNVKLKRSLKMMAAVDHTIIAMGINLAKIHSRDNFRILTADHRLADILHRATSVRANTATKLGLFETALQLGLEYSKDIYPRAINLAKTTQRELADFFGVWPLPTTPIDTKPMLKLSRSDGQVLSRLREKHGVGRDSLPYTESFDLICREFERIKGQVVNRHAAWMALARVEKQPKAKAKSKGRRRKDETLF